MKRSQEFACLCSALITVVRPPVPLSMNERCFGAIICYRRFVKVETYRVRESEKRRCASLQRTMREQCAES